MVPLNIADSFVQSQGMLATSFLLRRLAASRLIRGQTISRRPVRLGLPVISEVRSGVLLHIHSWL